MKYANITYPDINNGPGFRVSIFFQGCSFHCEGCFNSKIWDFYLGKEFTLETKKLIYKLLEKPYISGITLLGGEPLQQPNDELEEFLKELKERFPEKTVWLYTGYTFLNVRNIPIFKYVDVVVDGPFEKDLKDSSLTFRGSSNQNIINVENGEILNSKYDNG